MKVDSTSDERTANNVMRHEYRVLTDLEKAWMKEIKDTGAAFLAQIDDIERSGATPPMREFALARTKIEEAGMWAVKGITK